MLPQDILLSIWRTYMVLARMNFSNQSIPRYRSTCSDDRCEISSHAAMSLWLWLPLLERQSRNEHGSTCCRHMLELTFSSALWVLWSLFCATEKALSYIQISLFWGMGSLLDFGGAFCLWFVKAIC